SVPLSVALIAAMGLLALVMGLIPQAPAPYVPPAGAGAGMRLGLDHLTSSWPFAVLYLFLLLSLGATVAVRLSRRRLVFLANHLGLWALLLAAGLGAQDRLRETMLVPEGGLEWRSQRPDGEIVEMPLAIRLDGFDIEEYPAKLAIIDHGTGMPLAADGRAAFLQLDPMEPRGRLLGYDVELLEFLPGAVPAGPEVFVKAIAGTAVQAARIAATSRETGQRFEGWLATGDSLMPPRPLKLDGGLLMAMSRPEPRRFVSQVKVFTQEGQEIESIIEVNKPLKAGNWLIYQRNYDTEAGRSSSWSGFELVKDPWLPMAQAGLFVWALGSLGLVARGKRGRP
ncbi:MAG: hypothetical protein LBL95_03175, partial [Deltaproteobacteria bacterium]|nr:hypothetical protein [Deltaproteobacteria bacterium]